MLHFNDRVNHVWQAIIPTVRCTCPRSLTGGVSQYKTITVFVRDVTSMGLLLKRDHWQPQLGTIVDNEISR